jgi:tripartite-type tricarboxylate transporter receptor subunit TctC
MQQRLGTRGVSSRLIVAALSVTSAYAQNADYPNRPIKIVVPFTAGAGSDTSARFFGDQLSAKLGQPVLVENRPGASGAIGITTVKNAPADGYTILLASNSRMTVNRVIMKNLPYDPIKELKPVHGLIRNSNVFIVPPGSEIGTLAELVAAAKERPLSVFLRFRVCRQSSLRRLN